MREKLGVLHVDDSFTRLSNEEITKLKNSFSEINIKLEDVTSFIDSKKIISEVYEIVEKQYEKTSNHGDILKREFDLSEKKFREFDKIFEGDNRIIWVHVGMGIMVILACVLCCKVWKTEKIHTLA